MVNAFCRVALSTSIWRCPGLLREKHVNAFDPGPGCPLFGPGVEELLFSLLLVLGLQVGRDAGHRIDQGDPFRTSERSRGSFRWPSQSPREKTTSPRRRPPGLRPRLSRRTRGSRSGTRQLLDFARQTQGTSLHCISVQRASGGLQCRAGGPRNWLGREEVRLQSYNGPRPGLPISTGFSQNSFTHPTVFPSAQQGVRSIALTRTVVRSAGQADGLRTADDMAANFLKAATIASSTGLRDMSSTEPPS